MFATLPFSSVRLEGKRTEIFQNRRIITCPDPTCQAPARIADRWTFGSGNGPVEHVKTGCERGHWFTPTRDSLYPRLDHHPQAEQAEHVQAAV